MLLSRQIAQDGLKKTYKTNNLKEVVSKEQPLFFIKSFIKFVLCKKCLLKNII